jgi:hypothetical protein
LRAAEGEFEEASRACVNFAREFSDLGNSVLARTADEVVESWSGELRERSHLASFVIGTLTRLIAEKVKPLHETLTVQARQLARALISAAGALELNDAPHEDQWTAGIREMPRVELGDVYPELHFTAPMFINKGIARRWVRSQMRGQLGPKLSDALSAYERLLEEWTLKKCGELKERFSAYADAYRAQLEQMARDPQKALEREDELRRDLEILTEWDEPAMAPASSAESLPVV